MASLVELGTLMQGGRAKVVRQMTNELIAEGFTPKQILEEGFLPAMAVVGDDTLAFDDVAVALVHDACHVHRVSGDTDVRCLL